MYESGTKPVPVIRTSWVCCPTTACAGVTAVSTGTGLTTLRPPGTGPPPPPGGGLKTETCESPDAGMFSGVRVKRSSVSDTTVATGSVFIPVTCTRVTPGKNQLPVTVIVPPTPATTVLGDMPAATAAGFGGTSTGKSWVFE